MNFHMPDVYHDLELIPISDPSDIAEEPGPVHRQKRPRMEEEMAYLQHALWWPDGNIALASVQPADQRIDKTKALIMFRCHKSILVEQSATFSELLSQPPTLQYYGTPVFTLTDSFSDVTSLCQSIIPHAFSSERR